MSESVLGEGRLSVDGTATLLLCLALEGKKVGPGVRALSTPEYNALARWLNSEGLTPGSLLEGPGARRLPEMVPNGPARARVEELLARGLSLAVLLDRWAARGIRAVTRSDPEYPEKLAQRLKALRPPVLFMAGDSNLVTRRSIAVVGSRDADDEALGLAQRLGQWAARKGVGIVSGGARGVDSAAVHSALEAGGVAVGILADGLARAVLDGRNRTALAEGRLLLGSPVSPDARFFVGNAMGRNKLVYCLGEAAVVVSSAEGSGGTWAGAIEALRHAWVPVLVDGRASAPQGNRALVARGAAVFSYEELERIVLRYEVPPVVVPPVDAATTVLAESLTATPAPAIVEIFDLVWPVLQAKLELPSAAAELARAVGVRGEQARDWLEVAEKRGLAERSGRKWRAAGASAGAAPVPPPVAQTEGLTILELVRPAFSAGLRLGIGKKKLAKDLGVRPGQLEDWLAQLEGLAPATRPRTGKRGISSQPGLFD